MIRSGEREIITIDIPVTVDESVLAALGGVEGEIPVQFIDYCPNDDPVPRVPPSRVAYVTPVAFEDPCLILTPEQAAPPCKKNVRFSQLPAVGTCAPKINVCRRQLGEPSMMTKTFSEVFKAKPKCPSGNKRRTCYGLAKPPCVIKNRSEEPCVSIQNYEYFSSAGDEICPSNISQHKVPKGSVNLDKPLPHTSLHTAGYLKDMKNCPCDKLVKKNLKDFGALHDVAQMIAVRKLNYNMTDRVYHNLIPLRVDEKETIGWIEEQMQMRYEIARTEAKMRDPEPPFDCRPKIYQEPCVPNCHCDTYVYQPAGTADIDEDDFSSVYRLMEKWKQNASTYDCGCADIS